MVRDITIAVLRPLLALDSIVDLSPSDLPQWASAQQLGQRDPVQPRVWVDLVEKEEEGKGRGGDPALSNLRFKKKVEL